MLNDWGNREGFHLPLKCIEVLPGKACQVRKHLGVPKGFISLRSVFG